MNEQVTRKPGRKLSPEDMVKLPLSIRLQPPRLEGRKVSPKGIVDLPVAARVALGFRKDEAQLLHVEIGKEGVWLSAATGMAPGAVKASPLGELRLPKAAQDKLTGGTSGRYDLEVYVDPDAVLLRPVSG